MKEAWYLRLLYGTVPGRLVLKLLVHPAVSAAAGGFLDSRLSRILIMPFVKANHISMAGVERPDGGFPSFNAFFSRRRRDIRFDPEPEHVCAPCDGRLSVQRLCRDGRFTVKHTVYSLASLLGSRKLAESFAGGTALLFRLMPGDYHRYHFIDAGEVLYRKTIPGVLHCVRPAALEHFPVYAQNSRQYALLRTEHFGTMIQMEVGALLVGRICNDSGQRRFCRGEEKGYFEYGGSTVILIFRKGRIRLRGDLAAVLRNGEERFVKCGRCVALREH